MTLEPRWENGARVQQVDNGREGTLTGSYWGGYRGVKWEDGSTAWVADKLLKLVEYKMT